jgi:flagellar biosynthesis/type III secretory pathway protein FliH
VSRPDPISYGDCDFPDAPENPEFNELFTEAEQDEISARFQRGIERNRQACREAALRRARSENMAQARKELRAAARERYLASRFNPVLRYRPT